MDETIFEMDLFSGPEEIIQKFKGLSGPEQLEFFKIIEKKFFIFPSSILSELLTSLFFLSDITPIIAIEIFKLIRPKELSHKFINHIIHLLKSPGLNISYKLTFIGSILFKNYPHSYFFDIYKDILFHSQLDPDMIYNHIISSMDLLTHHHKTLIIIWQSNDRVIKTHQVMIEPKVPYIFHNFRDEYYISSPGEMIQENDPSGIDMKHDVFFVGEKVLYKHEYLKSFLEKNDYKVHYHHVYSGTEIKQQSSKDKKDYFYELLIFSLSNMITPYRILLSQFVLNSIYKWVLYDKIIPYLHSILIDDEMDHTLRMDVADILLNTDIPDKDIREKAIQIIFDYGNQFSIYHNKENVHYFDMGSVYSILDHLNSVYPLKIKQDHLYHLFDINPEISSEDKKLVQVAITRIQNDHSKYGTYSNSLHDIFNMVYCYINKHEHKSELRKRLLEEIIDMSGKCSTGYAIRLLNVLSGYDEFQIRTCPEDSLKHLLYHYINTDIQKIEDEDLQEKILFELSISSDKPGSRLNFLAFFRDHFPKWKEDLSEAMKDVMTPTDFDLYLRKAIYMYEGYH